MSCDVTDFKVAGCVQRGICCTKHALPAVPNAAMFTTMYDFLSWRISVTSIFVSVEQSVKSAWTQMMCSLYAIRHASAVSMTRVVSTWGSSVQSLVSVM